MSVPVKPDPCLLMISGASGDLTKRKLIPALYELHEGGHLPERFVVLGVSRSSIPDAEFRATMRQWCEKLSVFKESSWVEFSQKLFYHAADAAKFEDMTALKTHMEALAQQAGTGDNQLFYLSVAPQLAEPIITNIGAAGFVTEGQKWCSLNREAAPWQRIIAEKPFGHDLKSAAHLNRVLGRVFEDDGVYRIDHYLGKETVQNLMVFRFANSIFEPLWNRQYVHHVQIAAAETVGVEGRGGYYDTSGALKDMIQSHLLQLMAALAMEAPNSFKSQDLRSEQRKVLEAIRIVSESEVPQMAVRGQYAGGEIDGKKFAGYTDEPGVAKDSNTDTYAALRLYIDNWRWRGVPFYLRTGKKLNRKLTQIVLYFKPTPQTLFSGRHSPSLKPNRLVINVQPDEGISLRFEGKVPGLGMDISSAVLDFDFQEQFGGHVPEAYGHLLLDAMLGDQSLFKDRHEIEAAWRIVAPVCDYWENNPRADMQSYAPGSWGPSAAEQLFRNDGHWHNPAGAISRYLKSPKPKPVTAV